MRESVRIFRFLIIGTLNFFIMVGSVYLMMEIIGADYKISNVTAYVLAQINNFIWCKYWVFPLHGKGNTWRQLLLFVIAFGSAYISQLVLLLILVEKLGSNEYLAQFLGLFVYGAVNFLMNRRLTFIK